MFKRKRKKYRQDKLETFLEEIQNDEGDNEKYEEDSIMSVKKQISQLQKQGKDMNEIVEMLADKVGAEALGSAIVEMMRDKEGSSKFGRTGGHSVTEEKSDEEKEAEEGMDEGCNKKKDMKEEDDEDEEEGEDVEEEYEVGKSEDDKKQLEEAAYSRRHYNQTVEIIKNAADRIAEETKAKPEVIKKILVEEFADVFKNDNPRFDDERFRNAAMG